MLKYQMGFYCFPDLYAALQKCSRLTFQSLTLFQKDLLGHSIEKKKVGTKFNIGSTIFSNAILQIEMNGGNSCKCFVENKFILLRSFSLCIWRLKK